MPSHGLLEICLRGDFKSFLFGNQDSILSLTSVTVNRIMWNIVKDYRIVAAGTSS